MTKYSFLEKETDAVAAKACPKDLFDAILPFNSNKRFYETISARYLSTFPAKNANLFIFGPKKSGKTFSLMGSDIHRADVAGQVLNFAREKGLLALVMTKLQQDYPGLEAGSFSLSVLEVGSELKDLLGRLIRP